MKNLKHVIALVLLVAIALSACNTSSTPSATTAPKSTTAGTAAAATTATPSAPVPIRVWTKDRHDAEHMEALLAKFNAENPHIVVTYEMYTDNYPQVVEVAASTNELPDILCVTQGVANVLIDRKMMAFIDDYMDDEMRKIYTPDMFVEKVNMFEGKIFTLPATGNTVRLVYNKDIFARVGLTEPPKSVADMVSAAKLITSELKGEGIYGFALPMKNPKSGLDRGIPRAVQLSGYPVDANGFDFAKGAYDFTGYKVFIEGLADIWTSGAAFPGCESLEIDPLRTQFSDGKIGMYMTYSHSEWGVYTNQFPTTQDWGYAALPTEDGTIKGSQSLGAGQWYAMTSNCKTPDQGWEVMKIIYSLENLVPYYEKGLGVSVIPAVQNAAGAIESIDYTPFMGIQPTDKIWPLGPQSVAPEGLDYGAAFGEVIFGARKVSELDSIIADLNDRYNAAYEKSITVGTNTKIHYPNFKSADPAGTMN